MKRLLLLAALALAACREPSPPPVLFIGLDGADWQLLDAYMKEGVALQADVDERRGCG